MPQTTDPAEIERGARLLRAGRLVAFPTETVYGLGANALDAEAVGRIYAVKRRPATSPLIVHVASIEMAQSLVAHWWAPEASSGSDAHAVPCAFFGAQVPPALLVQ